MGMKPFWTVVEVRLRYCTWFIFWRFSLGTCFWWSCESLALSKAWTNLLPGPEKTLVQARTLRECCGALAVSHIQPWQHSAHMFSPRILLRVDWSLQDSGALRHATLPNLVRQVWLGTDHSLGLGNSQETWKMAMQAAASQLPAQPWPSRKISLKHVFPTKNSITWTKKTCCVVTSKQTRAKT